MRDHAFSHFRCMRFARRANDELAPLEHGRAYAAAIPGAQLTIVPECGHAPSVEKPKDFPAFLPFVDGQ